MDVFFFESLNYLQLYIGLLVIIAHNVFLSRYEWDDFVQS